MTILISILGLLLVFVCVYFLFNYIEELSIIFCIGFEKYNKVSSCEYNFSELDVVLMVIISIILSIPIYFLIGLKLLLLLALGYGMIMGILKSWFIERFLNKNR